MRKALISTAIVVIAVALVLLENHSAAAASPKPPTVKELDARLKILEDQTLDVRLKALQNATVEITYDQCRFVPVNSFLDLQNAMNDTTQAPIQCSDGEAFRGFATGVSQPGKEFRYRCCRMVAKIVPH